VVFTVPTLIQPAVCEFALTPPHPLLSVGCVSICKPDAQALMMHGCCTILDVVY